MEGSHWLNVKIIIDELIKKEHNVTVLVASGALFITPSSHPSLTFEVYKVSFEKEKIEKVIILTWLENRPSPLTIWRFYQEMTKVIKDFHMVSREICDGALKNEKLMENLKKGKFEVLLSDPVFPCVTMCANFLHPNFIFSGKPTTLCETMSKAEIWLMRTYWDFEFPRPFLPNFEFVGGLHCKPAKPLPKEMEEFVQSSGEDGVVVFSLGSMVQNLTEEKANLIALGLAQIPQKVSATSGPGHPKTKAFITHGGTNGIYEAIYHGIPMVGVPMFADQPDNIAHMKAKGAAVEVNMNTMTSADLINALRTVITDPSYKENAMRLKRIHHDQPVKPLDRAVFWIEFVMRHKGAKHLRVAAHDLSWFQYHSLDVIGFLLACVASVVFLVTKCFLFTYQKFIKSGKRIKKE
ncbi:UDP-glucuronosyltransferase 2A2 [Fukomys damarensis]|uniref:UDP-glucuronosyltransferase 2A2 n=1 Tax=Fukomys damarensis TaxID=885580 RepID=A0A091DM01_FUKDA|nr:UDP-glucuronosyltransferase 2A2 [Fukomys damarensis]